MNLGLIVVLLGLRLIGVATASEEEDRNVVFAESGDSPLKPAKTLQVLKRLSEAYKQNDCNMVGRWLGKDCSEKKQEVHTLIAVSDATEEKCKQSYVDHIEGLLKKYSNNKLNLVPYLRYYKEHLITVCIDQFDAIRINARLDDSDTDSGSDLDSDSDSDLDSDVDDETSEERERREREEREWEERHAKEEMIWNRKQDENNEKFMNMCKRVFFEGAEAKKPEEMVAVFQSLDKESFLATTEESRQLGKRAFQLFKLSSSSETSCDRETFKKFDTMAEEYKTGYNPAIREYVLYWRNEFWKKCKSSFLSRLGPARYSIDDEAILFPIVDYVKAAEPLNNEPYFRVNRKAVQDGLVEYTKQKLGKEAYKKDKVNSLFSQSIRKACEVLDYRFIGADKMNEICKAYPEYEEELDSKSRKWMSAINICGVLNRSQVEDQISAKLSKPNLKKSPF